jgi:putative membrane protein
MNRGSVLVALSLLLSAQPVLAQQPQAREPIAPTPPPRGTASFEPPPALAEDAPLTAQTFVIRAAIVNISETDLAELTLRRSRDATVQSYARRMLNEHRRAQQKLRDVAADTQIALPAMADKKHEDMKDSLKRAAADEFDAGYVKATVAGHDHAVALFDAAAHSKTLPQRLQRYALDMLPIIRKQRDAAYALQRRRAG